MLLKKESNNATGVKTPNTPDVIALKAEVNKLVIKKVVNVLTM